MKLFVLIITILFSANVFGQVVSDSTGKKLDKIKAKQTSQKVDSMDLKVISMRELATYLDRINTVAQIQFNLTEVTKYEQILKTIQAIYKEADKKRRK